MAKTRLIAVGLLICLCATLLGVTASSEPFVDGIHFALPLPSGRLMTDGELLDVEGELFFLFTILIYTAAFAAAGAGGAAVHENWFDEDYGIDGDDWEKIGFGAVQDAICGATGGVLHRVPI